MVAGGFRAGDLAHPEGRVMGWDVDPLPGQLPEVSAAFAIGFFVGAACAVTLSVVAAVIWWGL